MATDLKIAERIGKAVAEGMEDDPSRQHMYQRLLAMAAGIAAGLGGEPQACEAYFVDVARHLYRAAAQPLVVQCKTCGQKSRLQNGLSSTAKPRCAVCKTALIPGIVAFLDDAVSAPPSPSN